MVRYCTPMKSVAAAITLLLLVATGALAQQQRHPHHRPAPAPPPAPFVPKTLSTGGITTLPAPPPPGPFDARPGTYAPRYNGRSPSFGRGYIGGGYIGGGYYDSAAGIGEYAQPSSTAVAPHAEAPYVVSAEPQKPPASVPEPPRVAAAH